MRINCRFVNALVNPQVSEHPVEGAAHLRSRCPPTRPITRHPLRPYYISGTSWQATELAELAELAEWPIGCRALFLGIQFCIVVLIVQFYVLIPT